MRPENEFWYGDCGYITGASVVKMYNKLAMPIGMMVLRPTVLLVLNTKFASPTKKRKTET